MVIEIDDERAAAVRRDVRARRDGRIAEDAETHAACRFRVMARRANQRERGAVRLDGEFHRRERTARRAACDGERRRVDDGVARRKIAGALADGCDVAFDALDVSVRMDALEFSVGRIPRGRAIRQAAPLEMRRDARDAIGRLGMTDPAQMFRVEVVVDDDQCVGFADAFGFGAAAFSAANCFVTSFAIGPLSLSSGLMRVNALFAAALSPVATAHLPYT